MGGGKDRGTGTNSDCAQEGHKPAATCASLSLSLSISSVKYISCTPLPPPPSCWSKRCAAELERSAPSRRAKGSMGCPHSSLALSSSLSPSSSLVSRIPTLAAATVAPLLPAPLAPLATATTPVPCVVPSCSISLTWTCGAYPARTRHSHPQRKGTEKYGSRTEIERQREKDREREREREGGRERVCV